MRIAVIGAGALGASFGARLARSGHAVTLVDPWPEHVAAISERGLQALGVPDPVEIRLPAVLPELRPAGSGTSAGRGGCQQQAGAAADRCPGLARTGGRADAAERDRQRRDAERRSRATERVVGGTTMCSFRTVGPGEVEQTNVAKTVIGELDRSRAGEGRGARDLLTGAGYPTGISADIKAAIWEKLVVNVDNQPDLRHHRAAHGRDRAAGGDRTLSGPAARRGVGRGVCQGAGPARGRSAGRSRRIAGTSTASPRCSSTWRPAGAPRSRR